MDHPIELTRLAKFLEKANRETYANKAALKAPSTRPGSEDYHFEADGLVYHDTYWGIRNFMGGEEVWTAEDFASDKPARWGMNYRGVVLDDSVDERILYDFLRQALMHPNSDIPVRGPRLFIPDRKLHKKAYKFNLDKGSTLVDFSGVELITIDNRLVYRCRVHGGFI